MYTGGGTEVCIQASHGCPAVFRGSQHRCRRGARTLCFQGCRDPASTWHPSLPVFVKLLVPLIPEACWRWRLLCGAGSSAPRSAPGRARFAWRRRRRKRQQQMRRSSLDAAAYVRGAVWGRLAGRRSRCVGRSLLDDAAAGVPRVAGAGRGGAGRHVREGGIPLVHGARQLRFLR